MLFVELFEAKELIDLRHRDVSSKIPKPSPYIAPSDGFYWLYYQGKLVVHSHENEFDSELAVELLSGKKRQTTGLWNQLGGLVDLTSHTVTISKESVGNGYRQRVISNVKGLQGALRDLRRFGVTDDFKIKGTAPNIGKTVGAVLRQDDPTDQVLTRNIKIMYHGTSVSRWLIIQKKGLQPGNTPGQYPDLRPGYSDHNIYLATTIKAAQFYGKRQAKKDHEYEYVVLEVSIPDLGKLMADDRYIYAWKGTGDTHRR
jgi:hypothetical protein